MKSLFTPEVACQMIQRAKKKFCSHSIIDRKWKASIKKLKVILVINPRLTSTCANARFVHCKFDKRSRHNAALVNGKTGIMVINMNPDTIVKSTRKELYNLVSHEFAHCFDFTLRGYRGRSEAEFHDEVWSMLHKKMDGDGKQFFNGKLNKKKLLLPYQVREAVKEIKSQFPAVVK